MAHINRRYIDKRWFVFIVRGLLAMIFGLLALCGGMLDLSSVVATISVFLLAIGIVDSISALYGSMKKSGWINSVIDAMLDVVAAVLLIFSARDSLLMSLIILAVYTTASGIVDIFHGFLSTVDPTDRFIRIIAGVLGCVVGIVILNAGYFEVTTFIRFFGAYMIVVGVTSMIYGAHNKAQKTEDSIARSEARRKAGAKVLAAMNAKSVEKPKNNRKKK